jgi:hypothetical protein
MLEESSLPPVTCSLRWTAAVTGVDNIPGHPPGVFLSPESNMPSSKGRSLVQPTHSWPEAEHDLFFGRGLRFFSAPRWVLSRARGLTLCPPMHQRQHPIEQPFMEVLVYGVPS